MSTACDHLFKNATKRYDTAGLFLTATCNKCEKARLKGYCPEVLTTEDQMIAFGKIVLDHDNNVIKYRDD